MSMRCTRALVVTFALLAQLAGMAGGEQVPSATGGPPEVGEVVANLTLPDLDGEPHDLADRRDAGPVVLVFFRGAW